MKTDVEIPLEFIINELELTGRYHFFHTPCAKKTQRDRELQLLKICSYCSVQ